MLQRLGENSIAFQNRDSIESRARRAPIPIGNLAENLENIRNEGRGGERRPLGSMPLDHPRVRAALPTVLEPLILGRRLSVPITNLADRMDTDLPAEAVTFIREASTLDQPSPSNGDRVRAQIAAAIPSAHLTGELSVVTTGGSSTIAVPDSPSSAVQRAIENVIGTHVFESRQIPIHGNHTINNSPNAVIEHYALPVARRRSLAIPGTPGTPTLVNPRIDSPIIDLGTIPHTPEIPTNGNTRNFVGTSGENRDENNTYAARNGVVVNEPGSRSLPSPGTDTPMLDMGSQQSHYSTAAPSSDDTVSGFRITGISRTAGSPRIINSLITGGRRGSTRTPNPIRASTVTPATPVTPRGEVITGSVDRHRTAAVTTPRSERTEVLPIAPPPTPATPRDPTPGQTHTDPIVTPQVNFSAIRQTTIPARQRRTPARTSLSVVPTTPRASPPSTGNVPPTTPTRTGTGSGSPTRIEGATTTRRSTGRTPFFVRRVSPATAAAIQARLNIARADFARVMQEPIDNAIVFGTPPSIREFLRIPGGDFSFVGTSPRREIRPPQRVPAGATRDQSGAIQSVQPVSIGMSPNEMARFHRHLSGGDAHERENVLLGAQSDLTPLPMEISQHEPTTIVEQDYVPLDTGLPIPRSVRGPNVYRR